MVIIYESNKRVNESTGESFFQYLLRYSNVLFANADKFTVGDVNY